MLNPIAWKGSPIFRPMFRPMFQEDDSISRFLLVRSFLRRHFVGSDILADAADVARGAALGWLIASDHLGEKVHVVIAFARHLFADRLQLFKKPGAFIHKTRGVGNGEWELGSRCPLPIPHSRFPTSQLTH